MKVIGLAYMVTLVCALAACTPGMNAAVQTLQKAVQKDAGAANTRLNPNFRYLRVNIDGRLVFLASGNVEPHPDGPVEVWYSATREVVRLQGGRIVGITGLRTEWRNVSISDAPSWTQAAKRGSVQWLRARDVMPGYRFGVKDHLVLRVISPPVRNPLIGVEARKLTWFEESTDQNSPSRLRYEASGDTLPRALYAVDIGDGKETVVYGEVCIAADICFSWQRWSAAQQDESIKGQSSAK